MKKVILVSAVAMASLGMINIASAAHGEVQFIGAVTAKTCDLTPEVNGSVTNMVQLGTAGVNGQASAVTFKLKANPDQPDCEALAAGDTATIGWGGQFDHQGLGNQSGSANGAWVKLMSVNSKTANSVITSSKASSDFAGDKIKTDGAQFEATLNGGAAPGDYRSAAAFVVAYN
ncbi:fimbrial protein [Citrobacter portucalensis]|uniref:fimbrial protein n=1 Tax=Citrobacter portucalensis TaxID=1639133 RepID=UPI00288B5D77|nr:fimbrial protein [Citrobacter portucalensis]WNI88057.1 fimbrial protein [Citrobacter portucalensis]